LRNITPDIYVIFDTMNARRQIKYNSRNRHVAAFLGLIMGWVGIQKFYIGQIGLGVLSAVFSWTFIPMIIGFIDFIRFMIMDDQEFDNRYNNASFTTGGAMHRTRNGTIVFKKGERSTPPFEYTAPSRATGKSSFGPPQRKSTIPLTANKHYLTAVKQFDDYLYRDAYHSFESALVDTPNNGELYFQMACCNSLLEEKEKLFQNIQTAISNGFTDLNKIKTNDAMAYFRIQPEYDQIAAGGFMHWPKEEVEIDVQEPMIQPIEQSITPAESPEKDMDELLGQLKQLGELRQNGLLTDEEFTLQKRKLFA